MNPSPFAALPCGGIELDARGCVRAVNGEAARLLALPPERLLGRPVTELLPLAGRVLVQTSVLPTLAREGRVDEVYLSLRDGEGGDVPVVMAAARHAEGDGFVDTLTFLRMGRRQLRERDLAEAATRVHAISEQLSDLERLSEQRYRLFFEESPLPMFIWRPAADSFIEVNEAALRQYGYAREEFLRLRVRDLLAREELGRITGITPRPPVPGESLHLRHRRKDGSTFEAEIRRGSFMLDGGEARLAVILDITDRLRAEAERSLAVTRFVRLAESGIVGIVVVDRERDRVCEINDALLDMLGYTREELMSGAVRWSDLTPPLMREEVDRLGLEELRARGVSSLREKSFTRRDGSEVPVLVGAAALPEPPGAYIAFVLDLTERKRAEAVSRELEEQRALNRRMSEANRLKSEFLANMSHELRTPLNAIIGFSSLMHQGKVGPLSAEHREYTGDILSSARHLLQLINDVLDMSKVEAGRLDFEPVACDMAALVGEVSDSLRALAENKGLRMRAEVDPALGTVEIDPARLKQVLYNYLSNAIKFTPEGGTIVTRVEGLPANMMRIDVEDSGIGIAPDQIHKLFTRFEQLDAGPGKRYSGTGLGLALTKRLVEAQQGTVEVTSRPGVGSTFSAILPRRPLDLGHPAGPLGVTSD
ncbi:MAG TPA: PAS domain S-box protein [Polyangia bacterium]|nr:PAS domain S-box protein [Polyangia bacterium]